MLSTMGSRRLLALAVVAACARGGSNAPGDAPISGPSDGAGSGTGASDAAMPGPDAPACNGLPCDAIYVANSGADLNAGTQEAPLATIATAVQRAGQKTPTVDVYVQAGIYNEATIALPSGVRVHGGYTPAWMQSSSVVTQINGATPAVTITSALRVTGLDHVTLHAANAASTGASSYAIVATSSTNVVLLDVVVEAGAGEAGAAGGNGAAGARGGNGTIGGPGVEDSSGLFCDEDTPPAGGPGGLSSCGQNGGVGGAPGVGGNAGSTGGDAEGEPQSGGFGGVSEQNGKTGGFGVSARFR